MASKKKAVEEEAIMPDGFGVVDDDAAKEDYEKAVEEAKAGGFDIELDKVKIEDGLNVLWVIPPYKSKVFVERVKIHFGPMHLCGRKGKRPNPDDDKNPFDDSWFNNCQRCDQAWQAYDAAGRPGTRDRENQNPIKSKFKQDLGNDQGLFQAIDFTPFFYRKGDEIVIDEEVLPLLNTYVDAMTQEGEELEATIAKVLSGFDAKEDETLVKRLEIGMRAGVSLVYLNYETTNKLVKAEKDERTGWQKRKTLPEELKKIVQRGPLLHPENYLLTVKKYDSAETFTGRGGKERTKKAYDFNFLNPDTMPVEWSDAIPLKQLWDIVQTQAVELINPVYDPDIDLAVKARGLAVLTPEEIDAYLEAEEHSFVYTESTEEGENEAAPSGGSSGVDASDPNSFGPLPDEFGSADDQETLAEARNGRRRRDLEEDED